MEAQLRLDTQPASNVARRAPAGIWPLHKGAAQSLSDAPAQPDAMPPRPAVGAGGRMTVG